MSRVLTLCSSEGATGRTPRLLRHRGTRLLIVAAIISGFAYVAQVVSGSTSATPAFHAAMLIPNCATACLMGLAGTLIRKPARLERLKRIALTAIGAIGPLWKAVGGKRHARSSPDTLKVLRLLTSAPFPNSPLSLSLNPRNLSLADRLRRTRRREGQAGPRH